MGKSGAEWTRADEGEHALRFSTSRRRQATFEPVDVDQDSGIETPHGSASRPAVEGAGTIPRKGNISRSFRTTKAAVKMHAARRNIPSFNHGTTFMPSISIRPSTSWIVATSPVTRAKSNIDAHRVYSAPTDRSTGIICDQTISLDGFYTRRITPNFCGASASQDPESGMHGSGRASDPISAQLKIRACRWQVELFFKWIKQHLDQAVLRHVEEDLLLSVYVLENRQEAPRPGRLGSTLCYRFLGDPLRENAHTSSTCGRRKQMQRFANNHSN